MKRKLAWVLAVLLCLTIFPALALAEGELTVHGSAKLSVKPDRAILEVGYLCENQVSAEAQRETGGVIEQVIAALLAAGVEEDGIKTTRLNVSPVYDYTDKGTTLRGYQVEHMLAVTVNDITRVGEALDAALAAGSNQTSGITYYSSMEAQTYLEALAQAVVSASAKANALAIASGAWLGELKEVNELSINVPYVTNGKYENAYAAADSGLGASLMVGDLEVEAQVELKYEIK